MNKILLLLLFPMMAFSQMEVSMGTMVPVDDDYLKGYLSVGRNGVGGTIIIGGDSKVTYGNQESGVGYLGLEGYMDVLYRENGDWRLVPSIGVEFKQNYTNNRNYNIPQSSRFGQPVFENDRAKLSGGLRVGWKFIEVGYTTNNEVSAGFKLSY